MIIEIARDETGYVVTLPGSDRTPPWSVRFAMLQDACELADTCLDWFAASAIVLCPDATSEGRGPQVAAETATAFDLVA